MTSAIWRKRRMRNRVRRIRDRIVVGININVAYTDCGIVDPIVVTILQSISPPINSRQ
jgi:hypothetical protein